ncbi:putative enzyme related to lactoylglutathione lyase [Kitasatospora sp. MAP12-15]|uniref:VOC family protein n=1 Tax=unclassified Kitasatospora TaxID=2633591 RepID=UPI0024763B53|nr:VOC family protein [Kitasatospora sp. MAP12-44]MDH6113202.1 putative enzyme related to lactoylglutathione lyase [Kitasatospora sp. MAP12-44]
MLTTSYIPGTPNWLDLGSPDSPAAQAFYGGLFGWTFESAGPEGGGYGFLRQGGRTVAAIGPLTEEGARSAWTIYFHTADADQTSKLVEQAGGTVRFGPFDVFTAGRMAGYTDPTGAEFAVWQPGETVGLDAVTDVGTLCWTELHTSDPAAAKPFYRAVFGWQEQDVPFGDFTYTVITPAGGGTDASLGGIAVLLPEHAAAGVGSHWLPYFEVADVDAVVAKAQELGGVVRSPAYDAAGVGRFAQLADPHGAVFSVISSETPAS